MRTLLIVLAVMAAGVCGFYDAKDDVVVLTPDNFDKKVLKSKSVWIVEFYAPWCGHCKNLTPEWKKAASALKGIAKVGAVDADAHRDLGNAQGVQGFPTIKIFVDGRAIEYNGGRSAKDIVAAIHKEIETVVTKRL
jgi:protein disulfide-isomerase A6